MTAVDTSRDLKPCSCWTQRALFHEGHCCFWPADRDVCHVDEGVPARIALGLPVAAEHAGAVQLGPVMRELRAVADLPSDDPRRVTAIAAKDAAVAACEAYQESLTAAPAPP